MCGMITYQGHNVDAPDTISLTIIFYKKAGISQAVFPWKSYISVLDIIVSFP